MPRLNGVRRRMRTRARVATGRSDRRRSPESNRWGRAVRICIVTPAPPRSRTGNRLTALRWARILRDLGHRVDVTQAYDGSRCALLVALHARRSAPSIAAYRKRYPDRPVIVALTGTDLYRDIHHSKPAQRSLDLATRLIVLQRNGVDALPPRFRGKTRVIVQSVAPPRVLPSPRARSFDVCVLGHLRSVKDPFRAAHAARMLPESSRVRIMHLGAALSDSMARQARTEAARNPRYRWLGELPRWRALRVLAACRLLVQSSRIEGGANSICEALAMGVPVLSSRIDGSIGLLGEDYPGYFDYGDTLTLADLMRQAEVSPAFYGRLRAACRLRAHAVRPANERRAWRALLRELDVAK